MQNTPTPHRMLRVKEAAEFLGLSISFLNKMRVSGAGPKFRKLGARVVAYDVADLQEWLSSRTRQSTSDTGGAK